MRVEPTVAVLLNRFSQGLSKIFYPFFIVTVIARSGAATRQEIWEEILTLTRGAFACELDSHNRQFSRMEKTFQLVEPVERKRDATLVRYQLTEKGRRLYSESLHELIEPLCEILPRSP